MRKEAQAIEWLLLCLGFILLLNGSKHFDFFMQVFRIYFFAFTFGIGLWIAIRYLRRYNKKNIVVFHLSIKDELSTTLLIKGIQLLLIMGIFSFAYQDYNLIILAVVSFLYFVVQVSRFGNTKLVFHNPLLFLDAIFFEELQPAYITAYDDGIIFFQEEKKLIIPYIKLNDNKFRKAIEFEENQLLDDVLLTDNDSQIVRNFIFEAQQYAQKQKIPFTMKREQLP